MTHLDTHIALWLFQGDVERLSEAARDEVAAADHLRISPMVLLEIEYLVERQRFTYPATDVLGSLAADLGLEVCGRSFLQVIGAARHLTWTRDPFDRIITAQAMADDAVLVTADRTIRDNLPSAIW